MPGLMLWPMYRIAAVVVGSVSLPPTDMEYDVYGQFTPSVSLESSTLTFFVALESTAVVFPAPLFDRPNSCTKQCTP